MPHKADRSFFDQKREWSSRKDNIVGSYITAYLPKIATQGRSILLVDGFAGPGKFNDGNPGSPLILANTARRALPKLHVQVRLLCIEQDPDLFNELNKLISQFDFAEARLGSFSDNLELLCLLAKDHSTFVYIDPFTVEGLEFAEIDRVFECFNHYTNKHRSLDQF